MGTISDIDIANNEAKEALEKEMLNELIEEAKHHDFTIMELKICNEINTIIFTSVPALSAKEIEMLLDFHYTPAQIRKAIQLIRRHNNLFNDNGCYIIATNKGYSMSSDYNEIKAYFDKTQHRYENTTPQLLQMRKTLTWLEKEEE